MIGATLRQEPPAFPVGLWWVASAVRSGDLLILAFAVGSIAVSPVAKSLFYFSD